MSEPRSPQILKNRLEKIEQTNLDIELNTFRGITNNNKKCYVNSLLQLLFHCHDFNKYLSKEDIEDKNEKLLKNIYNSFRSSTTNSINIADFYSNWTGWNGDKDTNLPEDLQDINEFFDYFIDSISANLKSLFTFTIKESNHQVYDVPFLRVTLSDFNHNLRSIILNETSTTTHPLTNPDNLFIQLDRAKGEQQISSDFVSVNNTIVFNDQFYEFIGVAVFDSDHYHSIIKISNHYFDFNDNLVSPLFLDNYSLRRSSYMRCVNCSQLVNRGSVLFLYTKSDHDELSTIQLSPVMQNLLSHHKTQQTVLHLCDVGGNERYVEISNKELKREVVNLADVPENDLFGTMKFNIHGIPKRIIEPIEENRFMKLRQIFQWVSHIFRDFRKIDQGKLNAALLKNKLGLEEDDDDIVFIQVQGFILYDIIKDKLLPKDNLTFNDVQSALNEIIDSYYAKYEEFFVDEPTDEPTFSDFQTQVPFECNIPDISEFTSRLIPPEMRIIRASPGITTYSTTTESLQNYDFVFTNEKLEQNECEEDVIILSNKDYSDDFFFDDYSEVHEKIYKQTNDSNEKEKESNEDKDCKEEEEKENKECAGEEVEIKLFSEDDEEDVNEFNDDNNFYLNDYDWYNRVEILDAEIILSEIRDRINVENRKKSFSSQKKSDIKRQIKYECLRDWDNYSGNKYRKIHDFAIQWIAKNVDNPKPHALVLAYNQIVEQEIAQSDNDQNAKKKNSKQSKRKNDKYTLDEVTIKHWIHDSKRKNESDESNESQPSWGGSHNVKLSDDAILCLICLVLDFPTMVARDFTRFLNSEHGPCHFKKVKIRTVQKALHSLNFTVKKAAFCPPARNSIGLRIYRVAWSMLIDDISNNEDVLMGFIDEAGVTVNEGSKYGRSYLGITPLINSTLSQCKVSVLACVFPGFGVIYRFFGESVLGTDYANFIRDVTNFLRIHICSSSVQIVLIEDNCKIHRTNDVEHVIEMLKLGILPNVPYSPALNGVVEGYFGFIKMKHTEIFSEESIEQPLCDDQHIRENWIRISDSEFTTKISKALYSEWKARLAQTIMGIPMVSGHIDSSLHINRTHRLTSVKVYRNHRETLYK